MLSIFFGEMPEAIYNPARFFKNTYTDDCNERYTSHYRFKCNGEI